VLIVHISVSFCVILIVYLFTVELNSAVYVAQVVTDSIFGNQVSLKVYVYCAVLVLVGVAHEYIGIAP
jgi:hypothetical protein